MSDLPTRVRAMIAKQLHVDAGRVTDAARLAADLKADHLDVVDLVMETEDLFEIVVTDDQMEGLATVADLIAIVVAAAEPEKVAA